MAEQATARIEKIRARVNILPLFMLQLSVGAEMEIGKGRILADVESTDGGGLKVDAEIAALDFSRPPLLPMIAGFPIGGTLGVA